jgi:hypothetical protein
MTAKCDKCFPNALWYPENDIKDMCTRCLLTGGNENQCIKVGKDDDPQDIIDALYADDDAVLSSLCFDAPSISGTTFVTVNDPEGKCNGGSGGADESHIFCGSIMVPGATISQTTTTTVRTIPSCAGCTKCRQGTSGPCVYNGGTKGYDSVCTPYVSGVCFKSQSLVAEGVQIRDCCAEEPENFCPVENCKSASSGPCIFGYTGPMPADRAITSAELDAGHNFCLDFMIQPTNGKAGQCFPQTMPCYGELGIFNIEETTTVIERLTTATTIPVYVPEVCSLANPFCYEDCDYGTPPDFQTCFPGTAGPCRSQQEAPGVTKLPPGVSGELRSLFVCLTYLPGTDKLRKFIDPTDPTTGPLCHENTIKCKKWTTTTAVPSTTTITVVSTTTTTKTTKTMRIDASTEVIAQTLLRIIETWEQVYCDNSRDIFAAANATPGFRADVALINEGMIRAFMTKGFHLEAQNRIHKETVPNVVGEAPNERLCAVAGEICACNGLVRHAIKPAIAWGHFTCNKNVFESASLLFEPALANPRGNCYCRDDAAAKKVPEVTMAETLFRLARYVGASRMCSELGEDPNLPNAKGHFIVAVCKKQCAMNSVHRGLLNEVAGDSSRISRQKVLQNSVRELEDLFQFFFRYRTNEADTVYNNYSPSFVSSGNTNFVALHEENAEKTRWARYSQELSPQSLALLNLRFQTSRDSKFLAIGFRISAVSQSGCAPLGLKHRLGMCTCDGHVAPGITTTTSTTTFTTTTIATTKTTETTQTVVTQVKTEPPTESALSQLQSSVSNMKGGEFDFANTACVMLWRGPLVGGKSSNLRQDRITIIKQVNDVRDCAEFCYDRPECVQFGFRPVGTGPNEDAACTLYKSKNMALQFDTPYNHYFPDDSCKDVAPRSTKEGTAATSPVPATQNTEATSGSNTRLSASYAKETAPSTLPPSHASSSAATNFDDGDHISNTKIEEPQCASSEEDALDQCQEMCAQQHECIGVWYYFDPNDTLSKCNELRRATIDAVGNDAFDRMPRCKTGGTVRDMCDSIFCNTDEVCNFQTLTCEKCITREVKSIKCDALYSLSPPEAINIGEVAKPIRKCAMLTGLCTDGSEVCLKDAELFTPETKFRSISLAQVIIGPPGPTPEPTTTATTTATWTESTTGTSTPASSQTTTEITTVTVTPGSTYTTTAHSTVTTTATITDLSTETTTMESTASSTPSTTGSSTITSAPASTTTTSRTTVTSTTITETSSTTTSSTETSTTTTIGPDFTYKKVYSTSGVSNSDGDAAVVGRRFGNAFSHQDRLFVISYDGTSKMRSLNGAENQCKLRCSKDPFCLGVFSWRQADHVPLAQRSDPSISTGFSCVGLTSERVYGNYFSYDNHAETYSGSLNRLNSSTNVIPPPLLGFEFAADKKHGFIGDSISTIKTVDCGDLCTVWSTKTNKAFRGPCLHRQTGFCMDEVPGTAQCIRDPAFEHCNLVHYDAALKRRAQQSKKSGRT